MSRVLSGNERPVDHGWRRIAPAAMTAGGERRWNLKRARPDIELVVDGDVVDLNRLRLPPDTPVIDTRFEEE